MRRLGAIAVVLASAQVVLGWWWNGGALLDSPAVWHCAGRSHPEEIPVILAVFLALGAWRISPARVLTRRVTAVETLGAITVLAVDKTGTLTMNRMAVAELATANARFTPEDAHHLPETFHLLTEFAMLATPGDPFDPMEKAIQHFGHQWLAGTEHVHDGYESEFEYALSGDILAMTRVFASDEPDTPAGHQGRPRGCGRPVRHLGAAQREAIRRQVRGPWPSGVCACWAWRAGAGGARP